MPNRTIREAWARGRDLLAQASASPEIDARLLLQKATGLNHSYVLAHGEKALTSEQSATYDSFLARAAKKEPIPYLIGSTEFYGLLFEIGPAVLIPRPETELLVDRALAWTQARAQDRENLRIVDVGTGSGCIAISLAHQLSDPVIAAVDISFDALQVARRNARFLGTGKVYFVQADLLTALPGPFDLIVANLPYIAADEWTVVDDGVKWYEPRVALDGGEDGLEFLRKLLYQAMYKLHPRGALFLEIGWRQGKAVTELATSLLPQADVRLLQDYAGHDRVVQILLSQEASKQDQAI